MGWGGVKKALKSRGRERSGRVRWRKGMYRYVEARGQVSDERRRSVLVWGAWGEVWKWRCTVLKGGKERCMECMHECQVEGGGAWEKE